MDLLLQTGQEPRPAGGQGSWWTCSGIEQLTALDGDMVAQAVLAVGRDFERTLGIADKDLPDTGDIIGTTLDVAGTDILATILCDALGQFKALERDQGFAIILLHLAVPLSQFPPAGVALSVTLIVVRAMRVALLFSMTSAVPFI